MARISQLGPGRKTTGTIDGITYVTRNGVTYARSTPTMPASAYNTPAAKLRQAIFKMSQMHMKYHLRTIRQTFTPLGNGSATNRYYSMNGRALTKALTPLAERYVDGEDITITDVEAAISDYATEHPEAIHIASMTGYQDVYLTGPWPDTITLNAQKGDSTIIIIVAENGTTTTINADGTTTVTKPNSSGSSDSSTGSEPTGDTGSGDTGSGDTGSGDPDSGAPGTGSNTGSDGDGD